VQTAYAAGPFANQRTWFRGVGTAENNFVLSDGIPAGRQTTYTFRLNFLRRSTILNIRIEGTNFDGTEWKLSDGRGVVLSQRRFNGIKQGENDYTVVSESDYRSTDALECEQQYIIIPGALQSSEKMYYFSEHSHDLKGRLRSSICVRTPTCYLHSEGTLYDDLPHGALVEHLDDTHPCTDGLVNHINYRDDAHSAVLKQDKCDPVETAANRMYYGLTKPIGINKAVVFAVKAENNVRIGMFAQQQPGQMPADPNDAGANQDVLVYTIIIDDESESFLRRGMTTEDRDTATTVGFLDPADFMWFWADADFLGETERFFVRAGRGKVPGGDVFLSWEDRNPLPISHIAVSSWDVEGQWKVCTDQVYGEPHAREVCVDLSDCVCNWAPTVSDDEWETEVPCSEQCGDGTRSRGVSCLIDDCESNSALCVIKGKECPPFVVTRSNDCVVKLYEQFAHGYGADNEDKKYAEGFEVTYGSHDKRNLKPADKNMVSSVVIEGEGCSVLLFDGDFQTGAVQELSVPADAEYHVFNKGFDMPSDFETRTNSIYVAHHNERFCQADTKPATQIDCYETQGCCYSFSRCEWEDCYVPGDQCIEEMDDEPDGIQHREVKCEMRKFVCDKWRPAVDTDEMSIANAAGEVCVSRRYVKSLVFGTKTQCLEPLNEHQREEGCPPTPAVFLGSELMECNANKDYDKVAEPVCDGDVLTSDSPKCDEEDVGTDYAFARARQCGGSEVSNWMTCSWEPGAWSDCNGCGDVLQRRETVCKRIDGEVMDCPGYILETYGKCCHHPDFHTNCGGCDQAGRPADQQHCINFDNCQYEWHVKTSGHHSHSNCDTFSHCVTHDDWMSDDRASGSIDDQKAWCTTGPDRTQKFDAFVTYGLGACWAPGTNVETVANSGWKTPCPCYYGDAGNIDFGYHSLGDVEYACKANTKYAQRFLLDDPGMVSALNVDLEGTAEVKGAIYTDSGGQPGKRLYVTDDASSKTNRGWVIMPMAQEGGAYLSGGFYWLTFQVKQDVTCFGVEGDARGDFTFMHNADAYLAGNESPTDPFDPFQAIVSESGGFALYASYTSTGLKTHREDKQKCDSLQTCDECLATVDIIDNTRCIQTREQGCQSTKFAEAEGLKTDLTCQLTWGMQMYTEYTNTQCNGTPMLGPTGVTDTKKNTAEDCAQLCYMANAQYHEYNIGSFAAPPGNAAYCEGFEYNPNSRVCSLLTGTAPSAQSGVNCYMARELSNPCALPAGEWLQDSKRQIYYVAKGEGELVTATEELQCFGEGIWGGADAPRRFACDGAVDTNCDTCIQAAVAHSKVLGEMTCRNLYTKVVHACMFDEAKIECAKGQNIQVLDASYGRFEGGAATCATSPMPNLYSTEGECGPPDGGNAVQAVETLCGGKQTCGPFDVDDKTLGAVDGCETTFKYLEVRYECVEG